MAWSSQNYILGLFKGIQRIVSTIVDASHAYTEQIIYMYTSIVGLILVSNYEGGKQAKIFT